MRDKTTKSLLESVIQERILFVLEGKELDPVDKADVKKDFDDLKDKDIDNDGEVDDSDEYLHNRRKAITKAVMKESAYGKRSLEDLEDMYQRDLAAIKRMPKNAKYSQYADVIDREFLIRQEMSKRGIKVGRPKHPLIIESN
jgi:hypothetical protein